MSLPTRKKKTALISAEMYRKSVHPPLMNSPTIMADFGKLGADYSTVWLSTPSTKDSLYEDILKGGKHAPSSEFLKQHLEGIWGTPKPPETTFSVEDMYRSTAELHLHGWQQKLFRVRRLGTNTKSEQEDFKQIDRFVREMLKTAPLKLRDVFPKELGGSGQECDHPIIKRVYARLLLTKLKG